MKYLQKLPLVRFYSSRKDAEQIVLLCTLFSMALISFRVIYTGSPLFLFLVWNLFLAFIPYILSAFLEKQQLKSRWIFFISFFIWLMFVPNSFYIITDLFHLRMNVTVPLWYDLALLLSFAWNGLLVGILSVRHMERLFEKFFNKKFDLFFIIPVMALNGLGVYVGRYLRFNSWDIITNPFQLIRDIFTLFIHPIQNRLDWSMIICYTVMMTLIYLTIKKLGREL